MAVLDSLFNKVAGLNPAILLKKDTSTSVDSYCKFFEIFYMFYRAPIDDYFCMKNSVKKLERAVLCFFKVLTYFNPV